ncbi:hypothetical protein SCUP515_01702 [Seiridium cupressi]
MRWPSVMTMLGLATGHAFGACPYAGRDLGAGTLASVDNMGHGLSSLVVARWTDGSGLETIVSTDSFEDSGALLPDGTRLAYVSTEGNYTANIWVKDLTTGVAQNLTDTDANALTSQPLKDIIDQSGLRTVNQHYVGDSSNIGYLIKGGDDEDINHTTPGAPHTAFNLTYLRDLSWRPMVPSCDSDWDYRFMDVFPQLNNATGRMVTTQKQLGNSSVVVSSTHYTDIVDAFDVYDVYATGSSTELGYIEAGLGGAFLPTFSPDGSQIAVGMGTWFFDCGGSKASIYLANSPGDDFVDLTGTADGLDDGFPSRSPDDTRIVYYLGSNTRRDYSAANGGDETPDWSPDGELIIFTRQVNWTWDMANDAHAVWSYDGRIMWNTGMYGFRDECILLYNTFQPYGQIMVMNADGSDKHMVTDSLWEDSMPMYVAEEYL